MQNLLHYSHHMHQGSTCSAGESLLRTKNSLSLTCTGQEERHCTLVASWWKDPSDSWVQEEGWSHDPTKSSHHPHLHTTFPRRHQWPDPQGLDGACHQGCCAIQVLGRQDHLPSEPIRWAMHSLVSSTSPFRNNKTNLQRSFQILGCQNWCLKPVNSWTFDSYRQQPF